VGEKFRTAGVPVVAREELMGRLEELVRAGKRYFLFKSSNRAGLMEVAHEFERRLREGEISGLRLGSGRAGGGRGS
jgi:hypothetical protein